MANINTISDIFFTSDCHYFHGKILWLGKGRPFGPPETQNVGRTWLATEHELQAAKKALKEGKGDEATVKVLTEKEADLKQKLKGLEALGLADMNAHLVERHNSVVKKGSRVYNLGDVFLNCTLEQALAIRKMLNGQHFLLEGNHDAIAVEMAKHAAWLWVKQMKRIDVQIPAGVMGPQTKHKIALAHYAQLTWHGSNKGVWQLYGHSHKQLEAWKDTVLPNMLSFDVGVDCWDYTPASLEQVVEKMKTKLPAWFAWRESLKAREIEMEF
jgi:calcineurin-like phosphoesterase family protein